MIKNAILTERLNEEPGKKNGDEKDLRRFWAKSRAGNKTEKQIRATMRGNLLFAHTDTQSHTLNIELAAVSKGNNTARLLLSNLPTVFLSLSRLLSRWHLSRTRFPRRGTSVELNHLTRPGLSWTAAVVEGLVGRGRGYERNENKAEWGR